MIVLRLSMGSSPRLPNFLDELRFAEEIRVRTKCGVACCGSRRNSQARGGCGLALSFDRRCARG